MLGEQVERDLGRRGRQGPWDGETASTSETELERGMLCDELNTQAHD